MSFKGPNDNLFLATDSSEKAIDGCVFKLKQKVEDSKDLEKIFLDVEIVAFFSGKLNKTEQRYTVIKKGLLAIVRGFTNHKHLLLSSNHDVTILTDQANLVNLKKISDSTLMAFKMDRRAISSSA
jgi:RNase H-like domain found in reverse transcriptase